jgi:Tfp pilus assembly protein PilX
MSASKKNIRRREEGGFTLVIALGLIAALTVGVMVSYRVVASQAETRGDARRQTEAFFAAEAGLAEGREQLRLLNGANYQFTSTMTDLAEAADVGGGVDTYFQLLPACSPCNADNAYQTYAMSTAGTVQDPDGNDVTLPTQTNVRYRVFLRDDRDDDFQNQDSNGRVWVVSVGEVVVGNTIVRQVVQALVTGDNAAPSGSGYADKLGENKSGDYSDQSGPPELGGGSVTTTL